MNSDNFSKEISVLVKTELNNVVLSTLCVVVNILNNIVEHFSTMLFNIVQRLCNIVHITINNVDSTIVQSYFHQP